MTLPTPGELMKKIGVQIHSVKYGQTRAILNALDKPVLAYGIGYAGFLIGYVDGHGFPKWAGYSAKGMHSEQYWTDASFYEMDKDAVLKQIKENKFFVEKDVDEERINKVEQKKRFDRPLLGHMIYKTSSNWNPYRKFEFYGLKNGGIRIEQYHGDNPEKFGRYHSFVRLEDFMEKIENWKMGKDNYGNKATAECISTDFPDKDKQLEKIQMTVAARSI